VKHRSFWAALTILFTIAVLACSPAGQAFAACRERGGSIDKCVGAALEARP